MQDYNKSENYINRELSWLDFNLRVLHEARDKENPLFERLKFLAITSSNLDEFFMVRVASLKNMEISDYKKKDASGLTPHEQLEKISEKTHNMVDMQYSTYEKLLLPQLAVENISILNRNQLSEEQKKFIEKYFKNEIYPVLTPMAVDSSRPFPLIQNKVLNICALIKKENKEQAFATVQIPSVFKRIVKLPSENGKKQFILLEEIVQEFLPMLFMGYDVLCSYSYRVMRDADIPIDEDDSEDLLIEIEKSLKERERSGVIRLEVDSKVKSELLSILKKELKVKNDDIYKINGPIDFTFLNKLYSEDGFDKYKYKPFKSQVRPELKNVDLFEKIREGDILLHHPYDSFSTIVDLIKQAAVDENVLAIKQTLYRVSGNSPIIEALSRAAENGKQVSVLVELKARFDEENNIEWSRRLERAGCHVIYGLDGFKVHSKLCQITRKSGDEVQYITQIGTGNYNEKTACLYTDLSLMTADAEIAKEARRVFQALAMGEVVEHTDKLLVAPLCLQNKVLAMIDDEIAAALAGKDAYIGLKMNALTDKKIIDKLIEASCAGVKIDLIIRGICCLLPGVKDATENIRVISIVGRFLEHSRIYIFGSKGREKVYIASADYMTRNTLRRVEVAAPVCDPAIKERLLEMFRIMLNDNQKARHEDSEGNYRIPMTIERPVDAQETFYQQAYEAAASKTV